MHKRKIGLYKYLFKSLPSIVSDETVENYKQNLDKTDTKRNSDTLKKKVWHKHRKSIIKSSNDTRQNSAEK